MKNRIATISISLLFLLAANTGYGQSTESQGVVANVFKLNFLSPGISYEQKLLAYSTLHFDAYMDALILTKSESSTNQAHLYFTPSFKTEFRNYYNLNKREGKGLRTLLNSANYIAPVYIGRYSPVTAWADREWVNQVGAVWGMQRNSPKGFSLDLSLGLVYTFENRYYNYYQAVQPLVQLRLGYWIGRKSD